MATEILDLHNFHEPWSIVADGHEHTLQTAKAELVAAGITMEVANEHTLFFLARIMLCVNACVGLTNEDLARMRPCELAQLYLDDRARKVAGR